MVKEKRINSFGKIPLVKILTLKELDRLNPILMPLIIGFFVLLLGLILSFSWTMIWAGTLMLMVYAIPLYVIVRKNSK